ncbi:MAG: 4Fe-4S dicluster domain-containing protein, partial [Patescibacteria group bacterium]
KEGKLPACAEECPMGAIYFGDETENIIINGHGEEKLFKEFIRQKAGFRLLEELGTDPRVWYLPPRDRVYPAPLESEKED